MYTITEIDNAIEQLQIEVKKIEDPHFISEVISLYCKEKHYSYPLWEDLKDKISFYDPNGWRSISAYQPYGQKILFIEPEESKILYCFENSEDLKKVIENCFSFVFYVTNMGKEFLIVFNDHDYIIGSGNAKDWVKSLHIESDLN